METTIKRKIMGILRPRRAGLASVFTPKTSRNVRLKLAVTGTFADAVSTRSAFANGTALPVIQARTAHGSSKNLYTVTAKAMGSARNELLIEPSPPNKRTGRTGLGVMYTGRTNKTIDRFIVSKQNRLMERETILSPGTTKSRNHQIQCAGKSVQDLSLTQGMPQPQQSFESLVGKKHTRRTRARRYVSKTPKGGLVARLTFTAASTIYMPKPISGYKI